MYQNANAGNNPFLVIAQLFDQNPNKYKREI